MTFDFSFKYSSPIQLVFNSILEILFLYLVAIVSIIEFTAAAAAAAAVLFVANSIEKTWKCRRNCARDVTLHDFQYCLSFTIYTYLFFTEFNFISKLYLKTFPVLFTFKWTQ